MEDAYNPWPSLIFVSLLILAVLCGIVLQIRRSRRLKARGMRVLNPKRAQKPPIWPPRKPDDWGREIEERHRQAMRLHNAVAAAASANSAQGAGAGPAPVMPAIPSWEAHHAKEQARDPLQIRWAQNETGEWIKVVWGNRARPPENGGPLPVAQSMMRQDNGEWVWVWLGYNVSLDWQRGPQRMEQFTVALENGKSWHCLRPCGSPAHQDAPAPMQAGDEHGSSDWQSPDDLAALGAVRRP